MKPPEFKRLQDAFLALRPLLRDALPNAPKQTYHVEDIENLERALGEIQSGLARAKDKGELINPWAIAGLKRNEVRNTAALAGIWHLGFGGTASMRFLVNTLNVALPNEDWSTELAGGYRIETEFSPIGDVSDRMDLVIESQNHLVGIEVKIDAMLGNQQLKRYSTAMAHRASLMGKKWRVFLLSRAKNLNSITPSINWEDVADAARSSVPINPDSRSFIEQLIVRFGDHINDFQE